MPQETDQKTYEQMVKDAQEEGRIKNLTPLFHKFSKADDTIIGEFQSRVEVVTPEDKENYFQYLFDTDAGIIQFHLGTQTDKRVGDGFQLGGIYVVRYLGKEEITGGRRVNKFHIQEVLPLAEVKGSSISTGKSEPMEQESGGAKAKK